MTQQEATDYAKAVQIEYNRLGQIQMEEEKMMYDNTPSAQVLHVRMCDLVNLSSVYLFVLIC